MRSSKPIHRAALSFLAGPSPSAVAVGDRNRETGVLFQGEQLLLEDAEVEMRFEMPQEISGRSHSQVLARGHIVRSTLAKDDTAALAVALAGYSILRVTMPPFGPCRA
jgi:hypothetical protein